MEGTVVRDFMSFTYQKKNRRTNQYKALLLSFVRAHDILLECGRSAQAFRPVDQPNFAPHQGVTANQSISRKSAPKQRGSKPSAMLRNAKVEARYAFSVVAYNITASKQRTVH